MGSPSPDTQPSASALPDLLGLILTGLMLMSLCLAQENHFPADTTSVTDGSLCLSTAPHTKPREKETPPKSEPFILFTQLWDVSQLLAVLESGSPDSLAVRVAVLETGEVFNKYK